MRVAVCAKDAAGGSDGPVRLTAGAEVVLTDT